MDFDLTDDQRLLSDSVAKLLAGTYSFEQRKALLKTPGGWSEALWNQFAELGLLGLPIAEEHGGFGGGPVDVMLLMQAFGRHLVLEPYLATVVLGGTALKLAGDAAQQRSLRAASSSPLPIANGNRATTWPMSPPPRAATRAAGSWKAPRAWCCMATARIG